MAARTQTAVRTAQRQKRELEDLQLVMRVRNGDDGARELLVRRYTGFVRMKASSYFLAGGESEDLDPGGPDRPLQGGAGLPARQGDVVQELRRALRDAADHHRHQDRDADQAPGSEQLRLLQPHARRAGSRLGLHARRRAARIARGRAVGAGDLDGGAAEPRLLRSAAGCRSSRRTRCASISRATRTSRWPRCSGATRRRSTTRSSA